MDTESIRKEAAQMINDVGLPHKKNEPTSSLSGKGGETSSNFIPTGPSEEIFLCNLELLHELNLREQSFTIDVWIASFVREPEQTDFGFLARPPSMNFNYNFKHIFFQVG